MHGAAVRNRDKPRTVRGRKFALKLDAAFERLDHGGMAFGACLAVGRVHSSVVNLDGHSLKGNLSSIREQADRHRRARAEGSGKEIVG